MPIEAALIKPVVDALIGLLKKARGIQMEGKAKKALSDAIRELLLANPNENLAEAKIAVAKAANMINSDLILAEKMLTRVKETPRPTAKTTVKKASAKASTVARRAPKPASVLKKSANRSGGEKRLTSRSSVAGKLKVKK